MKYTSRGIGNSNDCGAYIREVLIERYLTQKELADALKMNPAKLSEILNGFRRPTKRELEDIMALLGLDLNEWRRRSKYVNATFPLLGHKF